MTFGDEWTDESFYDDNEAYQKQRRTLPEALDQARDGAEFQRVLLGLFDALDSARASQEPDRDGP